LRNGAPENIEHQTPNAEHRKPDDFTILSAFDVRRSMFDVSSFLCC